MFSAVHHILIWLTKKSGKNFRPFESSYSFAGLALERRQMKTLLEYGYLSENGGQWRTSDYVVQLGPNIAGYPFVNYLDRNNNG